jgi:hypothetical protein
MSQRQCIADNVDPEVRFPPRSDVLRQGFTIVAVADAV